MRAFSLRSQESQERLSWLHVVGLFVVLLACSIPSQAARGTGVVLDGRVVGVTDGDTITVLDAEKRQHTVRLAAIDAPETSCHAKTPSARDEACVEQGQPFGKAAKKNLSTLVFGKSVRVQLTGEATYGRLVGMVFVDGRNANYEQVAAGYAWVYGDYAKKVLSPLEHGKFRMAESSARAYKRGLWAESGAVPPWSYRKADKLARGN